MKNFLYEKIEINVRFNEADPLGIVWHGHYIRYFEDGREAFGKKYGLGYLDLYKNGLIVPIVSVNCNYKRSLKYGERVIVEAKYIPCEAAKMKFEYELYNPDSGELVATGNTIQVFLSRDSSLLQLTNPTYFENWKNKYQFS